MIFETDSRRDFIVSWHLDTELLTDCLHLRLTDPFFVSIQDNYWFPLLAETLSSLCIFYESITRKPNGHAKARVELQEYALWNNNISHHRWLMLSRSLLSRSFFLSIVVTFIEKVKPPEKVVTNVLISGQLIDHRVATRHFISDHFPKLKLVEQKRSWKSKSVEEHVLPLLFFNQKI